MGKRLKARRKFDEMDVMQSYIPIDTQDDDPAEKDTDLKNALEESMKLGEEKMTKVIFDKHRISNQQQLFYDKLLFPNIVFITRQIL